MSMSNTFEAAVLGLLIANTTIANLGDATGVRGSTTAGSVYVGLSTGTLTGTSTQTTTEAAYTSYARVAVARATGSWTASGSSPAQLANAAAATLPACTGGSETETYFEVGRDSSSTGLVLWYGALTASLAISNGITPSFAIGQLVLTLL